MPLTLPPRNSEQGIGVAGAFVAHWRPMDIDDHGAVRGVHPYAHTRLHAALDAFADVGPTRHDLGMDDALR